MRTTSLFITVRTIFTIGGIVVGTGLVASALLLNHRPAQNLPTATAAEHNITQEVFATGTVKAEANVTIASKIQGHVANIPVSIGTQVAAGDTLITLESTTLALNVREATAAREAAQAKLNQLLLGPKPEDIAVSEAAVTNTQTNVTQAQTGLANAQKTLADARQNLADTQAKAADDIATAYNSALTTAGNALITLKHSTDDIDYIFANPPPSFSNADLQALDAAQVAVTNLKKDRASAISLQNTAQTTVAENDIDASLTAVKAALNEAVETMASITAALKDTPVVYYSPSKSIDGTTSSKATLDDYKGRMTSDTTLVKTDLTNLTDAVNLIVSTKASNTVSIQTARAQVTTAQAGLASAQDAVTAAQNQLATAKAQLALKKAPITGIVTDIPVSVGDLVAPNQTLARMIGNGALKIEADVPEADILKLSQGEQAAVTFDALPNAQSYTATITSIEPAARVINSVVYYRATLHFDNPDNLIKPGMTANLTFKQTVKKALAIPQEALHQEAATQTYYVQLLTAKGTPKKHRVSIGARSSDGFVEITAGLSAGDKVALINSGR